MAKDDQKSKIDRSFVETVANLARVGLSDAEKEKYASQLGDIIEYIDLLSEVDTGDIQPLYNVMDLKNIVRDDQIKNQPNRELLLENSPEKLEGFIKVKKVL